MCVQSWGMNWKVLRLIHLLVHHPRDLLLVRLLLMMMLLRMGRLRLQFCSYHRGDLRGGGSGMEMLVMYHTRRCGRGRGGMPVGIHFCGL